MTSAQEQAMEISIRLLSLGLAIRCNILTDEQAKAVHHVLEKISEDIIKLVA